MAGVDFHIIVDEEYKDRLEQAFLNLSQSKSMVQGEYGTHDLIFPKKNGQTVEVYLKQGVKKLIESAIEFSEDSKEVAIYKAITSAIPQPIKAVIPEEMVKVQ